MIFAPPEARLLEAGLPLMYINKFIRVLKPFGTCQRTTSENRIAKIL